MARTDTADLLVIVVGLADDHLEVLEGFGIEDTFGLDGQVTAVVCPLVSAREGNAVDDGQGGSEFGIGDGFRLLSLMLGNVIVGHCGSVCVFFAVVFV